MKRDASKAAAVRPAADPQAELLGKYRKQGFTCYCGNVRMAARTLTRLYDDALAPAGLGSAQMAVLWAVLAHEPTAVGSLAATIAADQSTVLRVVRKLKTMGLIAIAAGADRRTRQLSLTARGRATFATALPLWNAAQTRARAQLGAKTMKALSRASLETRARLAAGAP